MLSWCCHLGCFIIWVFFNFSGNIQRRRLCTWGPKKFFVYQDSCLGRFLYDVMHDMEKSRSFCLWM